MTAWLVAHGAYLAVAVIVGLALYMARQSLR